MKKLLIIIVILSLLTIIGMAKLSDETLIEVNKLCKKHYGHPCYLWIPDYLSITKGDIDFDWAGHYEWIMHFEDGKLFIETQDGKWFIEMEKVIED